MKNIFAVVNFEGSRKVSFGIYLFLVSTALLCFCKISPGDWLACVFLETGLIGGGTIADKILKDKKERIDATNPPTPAS